MASYPPSTARLCTAVASLMHPGDGDRSELSVRCQLVYRPTDPSYTLWVRDGLKASLSAALAGVLDRPFTVSDNHWVLELHEAEALLAATSS
jgi:hypothetical protein